jgi:IS1 family transposase
MALISWNRQNSSASYATPKIASRPNPIGQKAVQKAGKVSFPPLGAINVLDRERHSVGRFPLRLSASALSFSASFGYLCHLKKYVSFLLTELESIRIFSNSQDTFMANKRLSKEKQALVLAALCEGTPINAVTRMFHVGKHAVLRVIRETGEAFADYMDANFRDLPCSRIEMDEQWQYVGAHGSRLINPEKERGDFWLWCCIDADTKLVFSHKVGKRDWWTGNTFVEDVRSRVKLPVQIATDNHRPYAFHIRQHFGYEGFSYGTETKVFGEPKLPDGTLARLGRNEGVRKMQTAERTAVIGSPDLESLTTSHVERAFLTVRQELKRFQRKGLGYSKDLETHKRAVALHFGVYNFVRRHHTLGTTPAVGAGLEEKPWSLEQVVEMTADYMRRNSRLKGAKQSLGYYL